ncbi:integrase [Actinoplanes sp. SE50]|uniref:tyrosine-type recombinase/integrase n=1 Tax=unclassified Actinoplanes TaxID=2626549 RepID=UPI00023ECD77|nr:MULTISPECIES: site-specific integrase [unclassified Actinoplanes]AEV87192.1 Integrase [Actinoplanes sp. SE50/110]ATO85593.1 integrase [Actinoplanes sp. SE50]SLM03006.1 integrase [Actinoplanes sp. SE50/110]
MTKRRSRGDGGLHWDEQRQRWIASVTVGYTPAGKRIVRKASGKTKTEANNALRQKIREYQDGLSIPTTGYTVADAVTDWLTYGLPDVDEETVNNYTLLANGHIIPAIGARKLRDPSKQKELSATDIDRWLADKAKILSTRTLRLLHSIANRAINRAMARDKVMRNVVALCKVPTGTAGRPSKSLTYEQAKALLVAAESSSLHAYVVLSLLTGARTEELRELTWQHVDLVGRPDAEPPIPPAIHVWHSVRAHGDTKTKKSRRSLALPVRCVRVLTAQRAAHGDPRPDDYVCASKVGTQLDRHNVLRAFRAIVAAVPGMNPAEWTPRELRHSFVSLLSDNGMSIEEIADLCGHSGTSITETVYRHQLRPVLLNGAVAMDRIFGPDDTPGA